MKKKMRGFNLYHKFALVFMLGGLLPIMIFSTIIIDKVVTSYTQAMQYQYYQAAGYVSVSLESMLESYNTYSKLPYYYNFSSDDNIISNSFSFENFRQVVYGERYDSSIMEQARKQDMETFLQYIQTIDSGINATHFIARDLDGKKLDFHYSTYSTYFKNEILFESQVKYAYIDKKTKEMILIPTHKTGYFSNNDSEVFTIARNYFDLRGEITEQPYVGTLFIDIKLDRIAKLFRSVNFNEEEYYVINEERDCIFSNDKSCIGTNVGVRIDGLVKEKDKLVIRTDSNKYGVSVVVSMDTAKAFRSIREIQRTIYLLLIIVLLIILGGAFYFSRRLTQPIHNMMSQMEKIEGGNFDIQLNDDSEDEIGILSKRFNQMSQALEQYINQSYRSKIKQNEAELTALKSQIYPHFLYNTLEIIRMTALDNEESVVAKMLEALSEQIHYVIGPMQDMVSLEKEIDIVRKYVYLLNCRISTKVQLTVQMPKMKNIQVPKVILQPIVENAYVHGIKPKKGNGNIMVEVEQKDDNLEISIMDNGVGMNEEELSKINEVLQGDEPGIRNEYDWQSIGLKNVHDRIKYLYGDEYGIEVTSNEGIGTIVKIVMPYQEK